MQCVDGINSYICVCNPGYTRRIRDVNIDECQVKNIDCSERGQSVDSVNTFTCTCDIGYTGEHCELEINNYCESLNITCAGHGLCVNGASNYTCVCDPRYTLDGTVV